MIMVKDWFDIAGYVVEAAGVLTILVGALLATGWFLTRLRRMTKLEAYREFRSDVGRSILLGLEYDSHPAARDAADDPAVTDA